MGVYKITITKYNYYYFIFFLLRRFIKKYINKIQNNYKIINNYYKILYIFFFTKKTMSVYKL